MPGKYHRFTEKEDRMAQHVAASERARGMSAERARSVGYATVNKGKKKYKQAAMRKKGAS